MAAPVYATDLSDLLLDMSSTTGWTALGGGASGLVAPETDFFIQGNNCISKAGWSTAVKGMIYNFGSGITVPTDGAVLMWIYYWAPNSMATEASGGLQLLIGSGSGAFYQFYVAGSDTLVYGGWLCAAVDPAQSANATTGSPTSTKQYFGAQANIPSGGPSKGQPLGVDAFRYGRCELRTTDGDAGNGYATFNGAAVYAGDVTRRWGLLDFRDGAYYQQGLFLFGLAGTPVDFRDSNRVIFIRNTKKVSANFNTFEVRNASSNIALTNISFQALGTVSPGRWVTTDNATVALASCSFTDMGTLGFASNTTATSTTFRRCSTVTGNGATFTGCVFDSSTAASSVVVADLAKLNGCTFASDGANHAVELTSVGSGTMTWNGVLSGYVTGSTGSPVTPTSTGNEAIYVNVGSGTLTISVASGASVPSIRSAGATVNVSSGAVTVTAKAVTETGTAVSGARVHLEATTGGSLPYDVTVTISNSGTTATVTHTSHGLETNDKVVIRGASLNVNNGVFSITKIDANSYSYTMGSSPGSSPTGTIKSTFVVLSGTTDGAGEVSMSRVFPGSQPVTGRIRKSTSAPFYKNAALTGTVSTSAGGTFTGVMISDD